MVLTLEQATAAPPVSSGRVDEALVEKAVNALIKWSDSQKRKEKAQLLEDDELLYVVVALKTMPERDRTNPFRISLPHPLFPSDVPHEVCLLVSDRDKSGIKAKDAKQKVVEENLAISKVIALSKLKTDYFAFEAKRKLCGSYDLFLADERILPVLPKLLGKTFYKKKKHPIPVNLTRSNWQGQIATARESTFLYVGGGTCSVVKVARFSQSREEIVDNVKAVIEGIANVVPRKWNNIRALFLKTVESVALPLYQALPQLPLKIQSESFAIKSKHESDDLDRPNKVPRIKGSKGSLRKVRRIKAEEGAEVPATQG